MIDNRAFFRYIGSQEVMMIEEKGREDAYDAAPVRDDTQASKVRNLIHPRAELAMDAALRMRRFYHQEVSLFAENGIADLVHDEQEFASTAETPNAILRLFLAAGWEGADHECTLGTSLTVPGTASSIFVFYDALEDKCVVQFVHEPNDAALPIDLRTQEAIEGMKRFAMEHGFLDTDRTFETRAIWDLFDQFLSLYHDIR